jgi:hypothetical protein
MSDMKKDDVKAVLGRVLTWPAEAQKEAVATLRAIEEEWGIIETRAARRDLATDKEVEQVFIIEGERKMHRITILHHSRRD